jgi:hypothetical protein
MTAFVTKAAEDAMTEAFLAEFERRGARLAEAERHLRNMYAMVHGKFPPDHPFTLSNVSEFLAGEVAADSASVTVSEVPK